MKIVHAAGTFPKTSETFILNQLAGLFSKGYDVDVLAYDRPDAPVNHDVIDEWNMLEHVTYHQTPTTYREGFGLLIDAVPTLLRYGYGLKTICSQFQHGKQSLERIGAIRDLSLCVDNETDLVHTHFGPTGTHYLPAVTEFSLPLVVSFYGYDISRVPRLDPSAYDTLFPEAAAITCLSEDMRDDLVEIGCPADRIHTVPLCIDPDKFAFQERTIESSEPFRLLTVARHVKKKGLEYAIRAVAELDTDREVIYTIAGDGPRRERLEALVDELDVDGQVEMVGWVSQKEVSRLMSDSHVFVLPSVTTEEGNKEGTPTVLLEAQSTGLPVVSTRHAGIPEIVQDDETGLLVPERDVDALVHALQTMLSSSERWPEMGRAGREYVESRHSIETVTEELVTLYRSLTSSAR